MSGTVVEVGNDADGFGNYVVIQDESGNKVRYAHANEILVQQGQRVDANTTIATIGNT